MQKRYFALSAIGKDRPGIVAHVAGLIYECGGNLEDSSMTRLGTQFALLILLSGPGDRVIVVIIEYGKSAYVYTDKKDYFEFEAELRPNSPYYPMPEKEIMGYKAYHFNPKFNEWVEDWKKTNKVD